MKAIEAKEKANKANNNLNIIYKHIKVNSNKGFYILEYNDVCYDRHVELTKEDINRLESDGYDVEIIKKEGYVNKFVISWE